MAEDKRYIPHLNNKLSLFFKDAVRISVRSPGQAIQFFRTVLWHRKASQIRKKMAAEGVQVPPIVIFSITNRCNLNCKGCYAQALDRNSEDDLSSQELARIIDEADQLGVSFFVLAGGEPLVREEIIDITGRHRKMIFLMFTNGLLIDDTLIQKFRKQKNVVPVISLEGHETETDGRRGLGIYRKLTGTIDQLEKAGVFFAVSLTATRQNIPVITDDSFIQEMVNLGCKLFIYLEYTAIRDGTESWIPTDTQREDLTTRVQGFREKYAAIFISVPGDEEQFGGCISSGRGFVHISADGDLEPCPFAPFSDVNVKNTSLKEALQSRLLATIRENVEQLEEGPGGCSLWQKREWVESLLENSVKEFENKG